MLGLLDSVERDGAQSQRRLASELGIALGLVNAYLKRCVKKGFLKARQAPARRYVYYLTPKGFSEKSRLTIEYLSYSFGFFRQAKEDCSRLFGQVRERGFTRVALAGKSDLAEIAAICAIDSGVTIVAIVASDHVPGAPQASFLGAPLVESFDGLPANTEVIVVTDLNAPDDVRHAAMQRFSVDRVLVPALLRLHRSVEPAA